MPAPRHFSRCLLLILVSATFAQAKDFGHLGHADTLAAALREARQIEAAPAGVTDLALSDIYVMPIGPQGLELTPQAAALHGQRVRLFGFMVRQTKPAPGVAMLSPYPLVTNEIEYSLSDDIPANTVFVVIPHFSDIAVPYTPGPLLLTGRFETTPREEADGRVSHLRLVLDEDAGLTPAEPASSSLETRADDAKTTVDEHAAQTASILPVVPTAP